MSCTNMASSICGVPEGTENAKSAVLVFYIYHIGGGTGGGGGGGGGGHQGHVPPLQTVWYRDLFDPF